MDKVDPYVKLFLSNVNNEKIKNQQIIKSMKVNDNNQPVFNFKDKLQVNYSKEHIQQLEIQVYDYDLIKDDLLNIC
jgi:hypothetical protein